MTTITKPAPIDFKDILIWASLVLFLLAPALYNGFPLLMDDSIAYSGQAVHWMRSKTPAELMSPLYRQIGYWALPLFNSVIVASAWLAICRSFSMSGLFVLALPLAGLSLQPLYVSAVLVDCWFFVATVLIIIAVRKNSPLLAIIAGILLAGHGSGVFLFAPFCILMLIAFRKPRMLVMPVLAIAAGLAVDTMMERKYSSGAPKLSQTFVASRFFSVDPELLRNECHRSGSEVLCDAADHVLAIRERPENSGRRDFFWDLMKHFDPDFDLITFERDHARPIILDALQNQPGKMSLAVLSDMLSFYAPETSLDFIPVLSEPMPSGFYTSAQAGSFWVTQTTKLSVTTLRYVLYATLILALAAGWRHMSDEERRWTVLLGLLSIGNDLLFATLSGPPDRYHHRILPLLALMIMIAVAAIRRAAHGKAA